MFCANIARKLQKNILVGVMIFKAAFLLNTLGFFVAVEPTAPNSLQFKLNKTVVQKLPNRFGDKSSAPIWLSYPVAYLGFGLGNIEGAFFP